jgi:hypothetical protein
MVVTSKWQLDAKEHHVIVQGCTEVTTRVREDGCTQMDNQTCPFCNQPVKEQEQTISVDGLLAHAECLAKASGGNYLHSWRSITFPPKEGRHLEPRAVKSSGFFSFLGCWF